MDRRTTRPDPIRRAILTALALVSLLTLASGCDAVRPTRREPDPVPAPRGAASAGTAPTSSAPAISDVAVGSSTHRVTVDGRTRTFRLYRPPALSLAAPVPLVVMLHGALGSGRQAEETYGWNAAADRHGFVVAYPDGLDRSWAVSADCCGPSVRNGVDDVAFIAATVAAISARLPIDPARVYATGISNGGMLAYRLACDTTTFAAIGVVAGKLLGPCPAPAPVSVLHIHGTADAVVRYDGRPGKLDNGGVGPVPVKIGGTAISAQIARWRTVARCHDPEVRTEGTVTTSHADCPDGRDVELITIAGAGHQWPGAAPLTAAERLLGLDPPATELAATDAIWAFFADHARRD